MVKKVRAVDYAQKNMYGFKKYNNIEKLVVITETEPPKKTTLPYKYYICKNQEGRELIMSDFMLEFGYNVTTKGVYSPKDYRRVNALQVTEDVYFIGTDGFSYYLKVGDYFVIHKKKIYGVSKEKFEENYKRLSVIKKLETSDILKF